MYAGVVIITVNPYYSIPYRMISSSPIGKLFEYFPQNLKTQCYTGFAAPHHRAASRQKYLGLFGMSCWAKPQPWIEGSRIMTV